MSGLAGILHFDPRHHVDPCDLKTLGDGIDFLGPDGAAEFLDQNLGIVYRAFHTTPESHHETQPIVQFGCVLTWDGRLDNREDLRRECATGAPEDLPDADLVLSAYRKWGTGAFSQLVGDWALALYDRSASRLYLARDYIGVRRVFYRFEDDSVSWCSVIEPLVLGTKRKLHLDEDYLSGCFYLSPPPETTPFREVRGILPGSYVQFDGTARRSLVTYWRVNPDAGIRYAHDEEYEEHFRSLLRKSIQCRLRADRTVLAELSGGLDSSSIVCVADRVLAEAGGQTLETISYFDGDEPSGDERPYFNLIEAQRGRQGHHIAVAELKKEPFGSIPITCGDDAFRAVPGYWSQSLEWEKLIASVQAESGHARVIISGLGGDELLGGVQYEAPELAEYLVGGKLLELIRETIRWAVARRKTVYSLFWDAVQLARAGRNPRTYLNEVQEPIPWLLLPFRPERDGLDHFARWKKLCPSAVNMEFIRYSLGQQLSASEPSRVCLSEKCYPYLDRHLFAFLCAIPRTQVIRHDRRRHLMRRALAGIVPNEVLYRKTKWFGHRASASHLVSAGNEIEKICLENWVSADIVVDKAAVMSRCQELEHGSVQEGRALRGAVDIEMWLRQVVQQGLVDLRPET